MKTRARILAMLFVALVMASPAMGNIIFVDADATGANDGSSWMDAFNYLQDALSDAQYGDEIRVAQGIYKPDQGVGVTAGDREATFQLKNGVVIKGGYAGFGQPNPDDRDITAYETILSGDLAGNDVDVNDLSDLWDEPSRADNSLRVVTGSGTDATAVLDSFTITGGNANQLGPPPPPPPESSPPVPNYYPPSRIGPGGGMFNHSGSPTVANCKFILNTANNRGGGMCNEEESNPTLTNCTFIRNSASRGGAMYTEESNPSLVNCTFNGNLASGYGGGMCNYESEPTLTNCTFTGNSAGNKGENKGGGMYNWSSSPTLRSCVFRGNSAFHWGGAVYIGGISTSTLTNCIFKDNSAKYGGGAMDIDHCNPTLINCTFRNNKIEAGSGAGILCGSGARPTLTNCEFIGNVALGGGGMNIAISSSPTLLNCTFTGNSASNVGGGIIVFSSSLTLVNCTFSGNWSGSYGGGIYSKGSDITLSNCVFCGDAAIEVSEIYLAKFIDERGREYPSTINVEYTDICGWETNIYVGTDCTLYWGEGNIDADPYFTDLGYWGSRKDPNIVVEPNDPNAIWIDGDYHLLGGSPCIDAGDPCYVAEPNETDLDGRPRVIGGRIDMGAYEYRSPIPAEVRITPRTTNLTSSGKWITCYIWLPEDYHVVDIDSNSILLNCKIQAESVQVDEEKQLIMVRFRREELLGVLKTGDVELTINGWFMDGIVFEGKDVIRVKHKPDKHIQAGEPNPTDGATSISPYTDLSWTASPTAASHDVYFGTSSPPPFIHNQIDTTFDPCTMAYDTTYYWRIDEVNKWGKTNGELWSFTTTKGPVPPPPPPP